MRFVHKTATMITFLKAHKRVINFSLVAICALWLVRDIVHRSYFLAYFIVFVTLIFSQLFWIGQILDMGERLIPGKPRRIWLAVIAAVVWALFFFAYGRDIPYAAYPRLRILIDSVFSVWMVGSWLGFGLVMGFWLLDRGVHGATWAYRYIQWRQGSACPRSRPRCRCSGLACRRPFLRQTAIAVSATPFAAAAYGLLYGRLDVEVTHQRIALARLPLGFRRLSHRPAFRHPY